MCVYIKDGFPPFSRAHVAGGVRSPKIVRYLASKGDPFTREIVQRTVFFCETTLFFIAEITPCIVKLLIRASKGGVGVYAPPPPPGRLKAASAQLDR